MRYRFASLIAASTLSLASLTSPANAFAQAFNGGFFGTCSGPSGAITNQQASCGTAGANGVVTTSGLAGSTQYGWISTRNGTTSNSVQLPGVTSPGGRLGPNSPTNGTAWTYSFWAQAGDLLSFRFNYVTSDGLGWEDYGYAQLNNALLFTARSSPTAPAVPGAGMPVTSLYSGAPVGPINPNKTTWDALGQWSNSCWDAGCGFTGWLSMQYTVATTGIQQLKIGVVNLNDQLWDTGMAFDFTAVATGAVPPPSVPVSIPAIAIGSGCDEDEYEVEEEEEDGIVTTTVKVKEGSCVGDDAYQVDPTYTGQSAVASQEIPAPTTTVPEPGTYLLVATGLGVVAMIRRKRRA